MKFSCARDSDYAVFTSRGISYARSSEKLYRLLVQNKYIGPRIADFQATGKLTLKTKIRSITTMWVMIVGSCWFFILSLVAQLILLAAGLSARLLWAMLFRPEGPQILEEFGERRCIEITANDRARHGHTRF